MTVTRMIIALVPAAAVAAGNWVVAGILPGEPTCLSCLSWLVGAPIVLALALVALLSGAGSVAAVEPTVTPSAAAYEPRDAAALELLGVLQEEGRFVDFLEEDLSAYPDEQIGAAARGIHEGCRKALRERITLEPVLRGAEGEAVTLDAAFDPATVRLTGNVRGEPPFRGVLRHAGWRATHVTLPVRRGRDPHVVAPAEVEIP